MKKIIALKKFVNDFAENKDVAKKIRIELIMPTLSKGDEVILNFDGITGATQSFIHALISDPIREFRDVAFENLSYQSANGDIQQIISIVYRYMQESLDHNSEEG